MSQKDPSSPWMAKLENDLIYLAMVVTAHVLIVEVFLGLPDLCSVPLAETVCSGT